MSDRSDADTFHEYARQLKATFRLVEKAIPDSIRALHLPAGSCGLDAGCGIGLCTSHLAAAVGPEGRVVGLDQNPAFLDLARQAAEERGLADRMSFVNGNILAPPFPAATFDWVWCKDAFWPGPQEMGMLGTKMVSALQEFARVVKPGGLVAILFWSSQMLLPGYPRLETRLQDAFNKTAIYFRVTAPEHHFLRAMNWFQEAGFEEVRADCIAACAHAPLTEEMRQSIQACFQMFYDELQPHVTVEDWQLMLRLCRPQSPDYLLERPDYYCFLTYSVFSGRTRG